MLIHVFAKEAACKALSPSRGLVAQSRAMQTSASAGCDGGV